MVAGTEQNAEQPVQESTKTNQILRRCFASGMFNLPHDTEAWAGYPAEKAQLIQALDQRNIENTGRSVVLSNNGGDSAVLAINDDQGNPVAVEFSVPSVTVPGFEFLDVIANETFPDLDWENWFIAAKQLANPGMIYYNTGERGFAAITVQKEELHVDYVYVSTVQGKQFEYKCKVAFDVSLDSPGNVDFGRCTKDSDLFV
eukprot:TRINITY_DN755_c1_g1_i1.p3 TRINITY_DN755_c1_g1~~TRINITY_DN755_c1_g1_i1.p3  ORF type:complete len:215 (-),score=31.34 TRINITY_DN755_c1_g1_i1:282-884(-)